MGWLAFSAGAVVGLSICMGAMALLNWSEAHADDPYSTDKEQW